MQTYEANRWLSFLQAAIPGLTEQDAQWLVSLPITMDSPLPALEQLPAPRNRNKRTRKAPAPDGLNTSNKKRQPAPQSAPVRCSPRSHPVSTPTSVSVGTDAPSSLAASHQALRPQLSQAFRRLYGTAQHRGILAGLAILKLYCECLGTTWTGSPARDPIVFFRTPDMGLVAELPPKLRPFFNGRTELCAVNWGRLRSLRACPNRVCPQWPQSASVFP